MLNSLFDRQRELNIAQAQISEELVLINQKILYALCGHARAASQGLVAATHTARVGGSRPARSRRRHSWFERGEALKLMKRTVKRPMRPAQVVHAIMSAKGYATTLSGDSKKRAESALHQAVISAVKARALSRDATGKVRINT
jgi:hypothetical protein